MRQTERFHTVIIGGGQAGLAAAYHLAQRGVPFVVLEANERVGDSWRQRWDSLRLFSPARFDSLTGLPFPAPGHYFPTKNEMADYLEAYVNRFELPVRTGVRVDRVSRCGDHFEVSAGDQRFEAENVIVAMATFQKPVVPQFAAQLDSSIVQIHSADYRNPQQLQPGPVLLVGAGNSGAEIALDIARKHRVWLSGRHVGHVPFRVDGLAARLILVRLVLRVVFHRIMTLKTPMGRKMRPKMLSHGGPLVRVKPSDLSAANIERVARVAGVRAGKPLLDDGRVLDVANVIWCTGFHPGFSWIDLPVFDERGLPEQERGIVHKMPGLYFLGLMFLYAASSTMIHGVSRDAEYIANAIATRARGALKSAANGPQQWTERTSDESAGAVAAFSRRTISAPAIVSDASARQR
jgi:putative flavoprotein involved in K+ transport